MSNWNMIGHEWAVQMLQEQIRNDSLRHAYLFSGPPGVGRRTLALHLAQALNCLQPAAPAEPCGTCRTCRQIGQMQYADLHVIESVKEGSELKIDQIRAIRQRLTLTPYMGKYQVALFLRFHEANLNASNALLKTLEEPSGHSILLLTADTPEQLLPTVVSRCEVLRLRPLPVETVEAALKERGADQEEARLLAHISGGRPGYALRLRQDKDLLAFRKQRLDELQGLLQSNRRGRFAYAEKLTSRKKKDEEAEERFRDTLLIWLSFWRDVLLRVAEAQAALANVDRAEEIEALAERLSPGEAQKLVRAAEEAIEKLENNINARLLAEVLLLDWPHG